MSYKILIINLYIGGIIRKDNCFEHPTVFIHYPQTLEIET